MVLRHPCRGSMYGAQAPLQRKHVWCSGTLAEEACMVLKHPCRGSMYGAQAPLQRKYVWCSGTLAEEVCMVLRHPCRRSEEHRLNSSHMSISYAVFCLKKKK